MSTIANLYADMKTLCQQWFYTKSEVDSALDDIIDTIYPVGSIYMSANDVDPSTLFGGTWQRIEDKFLLSKGSSYTTLGDTGGSATVSLTQSQMPRHTHTQVQHTHSALDGTYFVETNATSLGTGSSKRQATTNTNGNFYWYSNQSSAPTIARHSSTAYATPTNKYTGGSGSSESASDGASHENMPPYLVVNVWKRTA